MTDCSDTALAVLQILPTRSFCQDEIFRRAKEARRRRCRGASQRRADAGLAEKIGAAAGVGMGSAGLSAVRVRPAPPLLPASAVGCGLSDGAPSGPERMSRPRSATSLSISRARAPPGTPADSASPLVQGQSRDQSPIHRRPALPQALPDQTERGKLPRRNDRNASGNRPGECVFFIGFSISVRVA